MIIEWCNAGSLDELLVKFPRKRPMSLADLALSATPSQATGSYIALDYYLIEFVSISDCQTSSEEESFPTSLLRSSSPSFAINSPQLT